VALAALSACAVPTPGPRGPAPSTLAEEEPVAFLLERAAALRLTDTVRLELVRLNLRLFERNQPLRFALDTLLERAHVRQSAEHITPNADSYPESVRQDVAPILTRLRANNEAARDTAWALLTPEQRERAERLRRTTWRPGREGERVPN
jgi:hypothetical protein